MTKKFISLRRKLVVKLGITYLVALLFVFTLIIAKNTVDFNTTIAETEQRLNSALINKGMLLIQNNAIALVGLVEDNAFGAVEEIVTNTVHNNDDILYGIFSDVNNNDWVYTFKNDHSEDLTHAVNNNRQWAFQQTSAASIKLSLAQVKIIEFAAPVLIDEEIQGVIRYGISTKELTETITAANSKAVYSLLQTLVSLFLIGAITLWLVYWRTDKVAKNITIPLNMLTDAANIVASGQYDQAIDIKTNDEIGILARNFNSMTEKIKRTIADLAKINQVGNELATIRNDTSTFEQVLSNLVVQLECPLGMIFQGNQDSPLVLLSRYGAVEIDVEQLLLLLNEQAPALNKPQQAKEVNTTMTIDICQLNSQPSLKSLIFMPFGQNNSNSLYVALFSSEANRQLASSEQEFCQSISHLMITSLKNIEMTDLLAEQNKNLEQTVNQRTEELRIQNQTLSNTLTELEQTQSQLIESEKMASLGSLVAGISHEVNTPLGVAVTAASHLNQHTQEFKTTFEQGKLTKSGFSLYMETTTETTEIILSNLDRASTLIQSFKQIAVDQSSDTKGEFDLKQHIEMLITSLRPSFKSRPIDIEIIGEHFKIDSYPGLLNQVITNLIINSIKHGLADCQSGKIIIHLLQSEDLVIIMVEDNGIGIPDEIKTKVFDPFFTTQRGTGGSGLGLNIVYNIVKQKLAGDIHIDDNQPNGVRFTVSIPLK